MDDQTLRKHFGSAAFTLCVAVLAGIAFWITVKPEQVKDPRFPQTVAQPMVGVGQESACPPCEAAMKAQQQLDEVGDAEPTVVETSAGFEGD